MAPTKELLAILSVLVSPMKIATHNCVLWARASWPGRVPKSDSIAYVRRKSDFGDGAGQETGPHKNTFAGIQAHFHAWWCGAGA